LLFVGVYLAIDWVNAENAGEINEDFSWLDLLLAIALASFAIGTESDTSWSHYALAAAFVLATLGHCAGAWDTKGTPSHSTTRAALAGFNALGLVLLSIGVFVPRPYSLWASPVAILVVVVLFLALCQKAKESVRTIVAMIGLLCASIFVWTRARQAETSALAEGWMLVGIVQNFDPGKPCGTTPALKDQIPAVLAALQAMRPSRVRVIGVTDTTPLTPLVRDFVGNNAGLAHMRAECVTRWLDTNKEFAGVEFVEGVDPPREFRSADSMDRAVVVLAWPRHPDDPWQHP